MARFYLRYLAAFTAQASSAITLNTFSGGSQTDFDTTAIGNANGCNVMEFEVDVTAAPSAEASCLIYEEALQHDGVGYGEPRLVGNITIPVTVTNKYITRAIGTSEKGRYKIYAKTQGFTASLSVRGAYSADA